MSVHYGFLIFLQCMLGHAGKQASVVHAGTCWDTGTQQWVPSCSSLALADDDCGEGSEEPLPYVMPCPTLWENRSWSLGHILDYSASQVLKYQYTILEA